MKHTFRAFVRAPGFFAVVVLTLAAGIGANTAIFSVVRGVLLRPLPYREPDRLVALYNGSPKYTNVHAPMSVLDYRDLRAGATRLENVGAYAEGDGNLIGDGAAQRVGIGFVTPEFFPVLGVAPLAGRWIAPDEGQAGKDHVAVLSYDLWKRRYAGDHGIVGREVRIDKDAYRVIGVLPASFNFNTSFDLYVPLTFTPAQLEERARDQHFLWVIGRLAPGASLADLRGDLAFVGDRVSAAHPEMFADDHTWLPHPAPLLDSVVGDVRPSLLFLAGAAGLVLLIVCGNVASLLLARAGTRRRELSVRAALGASRRRLAGQLLGESLILSAIGGVLGILVAMWGTDLLLSLAPEDLPRLSEIHVDGAVLGFSVLVTAVTGTLFGLIPAWSASRVDLAEALHEGGRGSAGGIRPRRIRRALVVAETALALLLVTCAALVTRSFAKVMAVDPGIRPEGVLTVKATLPSDAMPSDADNARFQRWFTEARARLLAIPGVTQAAAINQLPLGGHISDRLLEIQGHPPAPGARPIGADMAVVTPGYFQTLGIPILAGRDFTAEDQPSSPCTAVVSQSFVRKYLSDGEPLGRGVRLTSPPTPFCQVIGVVGDVRNRALEEDIEPQMYFDHAQVPDQASMALVVRSGMPMGQLAAQVRAVLTSYDPQQPIFDMKPMADWLHHAVEGRRFVLVLFELFAGLALGLAALGLYGLLAHAVGERRREIGVRVALGASRASILGLVVREGLGLLGLGVAIGAAAGVAVARLVAGLLYGVAPFDPLSLAAAVVLLTLAAALATWLPVRRALRVDPVDTLRDE